MSATENPSAFPHGAEAGWWDAETGMTLRDYFAGQAVAGLLASNAMYGGKTNNRSALAADAYATVDAMLAARQQEQSHEA